MKNLILMADAYKYSHHKLYYPGTEKIYSYLESRGGKFDKTVFFGLQYFLKEYLEGVVFTSEGLEEAVKSMTEVFGRDDVFEADKFQYIIDRHGGKLPIKIKAVPEGSIVPVSNVLLTIENTDPKCFWLTNFLETLLMQLWYPSTVATISYEVKEVVKKYYRETASESTFAGINFVLNDFGFRGVSSPESAGIGGMSHLLNFAGSDTILGSLFAKKYYDAITMQGISVPATEHSVCTLLGEEGELEMFEHILDTYPTGIVACVSDSYDIFRACSEYWGGHLKEKILKREGTLVIRPDSGDPIQTLLKVFSHLFESFGYSVNEKGFKVLPKQVRVIQGDGINYESIVEIYEALKENKISAENLVLGMGGALLQKLDRDTQKFALKCSYAEINGEGRKIQKRPLEIDASGKIVASFKTSKGGKLKLIQKEGEYVTVEQNGFDENDCLETVFLNGEIIRNTTFAEIKKRVE